MRDAPDMHVADPLHSSGRAKRGSGTSYTTGESSPRTAGSRSGHHVGRGYARGAIRHGDLPSADDEAPRYRPPRLYTAPEGRVGMRQAVDSVSRALTVGLSGSRAGTLGRARTGDVYRVTSGMFQGDPPPPSTAASARRSRWPSADPTSGCMVGRAAGRIREWVPS